MPDGFKKNPWRTDAPDMSDTVVNDTTNAFLLDGDVPRLATPTLPPSSNLLDFEQLAGEPSSRAGGSASLPAPGIGAEPVLLALAGPSLPTPGGGATTPSTPIPTSSPSSTPTPTADGHAALPAQPRHPMAHLMPDKPAAAEASTWAAELRAAKRAKAKKIKIGVSIGFLAFAGAVGPPLGSWLVDAINESGKTQTDDAPATTEPAADPDSDSDAGVLEGVVGLPDQARDVVTQTNDNATPESGSTTAP